MNTEFRSFVAPIATPLDHTNPFQWYIVGSNGDIADTFPTAQPSFGFTGPVNGGPNDTDVKLLMVGLVTVPQLDPSKWSTTPAVPTDHPSVDVV
jgi:hypothetical protein